MKTKGKCRILAIVYFILGFIASFKLADYGGDLLYERDWVNTICIFLGSMFCVSIVCVILFTLENLMNNQEQMLQMLEKLCREKETSGNVDYSNSRAQITDTSALSNTGGEHWICSTCGESNSRLSLTCKGCGTYK